MRHLLKLVWKRKRANVLLILEIFASFVVVFAVLTLAATMILRWRKPLGFDYRDVWTARLNFGPRAEMARDGDDSRQRAIVDAMVREVRTLPQIESIAAADSPPYGNSTWTSNLRRPDGSRIEVTRDVATDDYLRVLRMRLLHGRWFSAEDEAADRTLVVLDADAAQTLFGTTDVVGRTVDPGSEKKGDEARIIGVVAPFRKDGELSKDRVNMVFERMSLTRKQGRVANDLVMRVRPGTAAVFEQTLLQRLHAVAPDVDVRIQHMDQWRAIKNKVFLAPAIMGGVVAAFLIVMVALGLSGVLWQNVTRRREEIGLRRALGATRASVNRQILAEVALLATLATIVGVVIVAQLPVLGIFNLVTKAAYAVGLGGALATIYALTLLCGVYPSWLAGRVQPAQALHYE